MRQTIMFRWMPAGICLLSLCLFGCDSGTPESGDGATPAGEGSEGADGEGGFSLQLNDGQLDVKGPGYDVQVDTEAGKVDVQAPGTDVRYQDGDVQVEAPGTSVNVDR